MPGNDEGVAAARWARAEYTLYGSLVADPPTYERVVGLVAILLDHLRATVADQAGLVAASERGTDLIAEVCPEALVPWVPAEPALSAACAVRSREVAAAAGRQKRVSALAAARASGHPWARIERVVAGMHPMVGPVTIVHLPTGTAVDATTAMDPETGAAVFTVRAVRVDPGTGDIVGDEGTLGPDRTAATVADRDAHVAQLQRHIERLDTENHFV
ncbi:MAG: hypothetical protein ACR2MN_03670 [Acidimicrobiales bacterium]